MHIKSTAIAGAWLIDGTRAGDERGWFVRVFDEDAYAQAGLCTAFPQHGEARNALRGTVRGLHYQHPPHDEIRVIRCTRGAVYDVLVDLRPGPDYGTWESFELSEYVPRALYAPAGVAHGYQTLRDDTELHYLISARYAPAAAGGIAYDSPALGIPWPLPVTAISERDRNLPPFAPEPNVIPSGVEGQP
jgi:dTDP-4-dehydrorhamnose 3,5-epimerase